MFVGVILLLICGDEFHSIMPYIDKLSGRWRLKFNKNTIFLINKIEIDNG